MMEVGIYEDAEITGSALQKGKNTDDPVVCIYFFDHGESITAWLHTTPDAWPYTEKKLRSCGFDPAEHDYNLAALNLDGDANPIRGNRTRIEVVDQEYPKGSGKFNRQVSWIGDIGPAERMPDQEAVSFTQNLRKRLVASQGKPAAPAGRPTTSTRRAPAASGPSPAAAGARDPADTW